MEELEQLTSSPPTSPGGSAAALDPKTLAAAVQGCAQQLAKGFDPRLGGFGGPPKFPRPSEINLLLRAATEQVGKNLTSREARLALNCVLCIKAAVLGQPVCCFTVTGVLHGAAATAAAAAAVALHELTAVALKPAAAPGEQLCSCL